MTVIDYMKDHIVFLDGGMGTQLQNRGLAPGEYPERWNVSHREDVIEIQKTYFDMGSNVIATNTFGANAFKFDDAELDAVIRGAVSCAREAQKRSTAPQEKFVALDVGPLGRLLQPYGDLPFEKAVETYAKTIAIGADAGVDLILIETMNDSLDTKAALLAAKETCPLPVFVSNAYGEDGKLMTGACPAAMVAMLEGMGADAIGVNCSLGPKQLTEIVKDYLTYASVPVILKPNAGLPRSENGQTVFDVGPKEFAEDMADYLKDGVRIAGGCCGTTPAHIGAMTERSKEIWPVPVTKKNRTLVSSYTHAVEFGQEPVIIGERINPTGKKKFKEALKQHDLNYVLDVGLTQQDKGAHILDVNVGLPEIDEAAMLKEVTYELQAIIDLPLQIDTTDPVAMEGALRIYNGKAMINSVSGKEEVMRTIFPLAKKYGGLVVCLTLDDEGIPSTAEKRVAIAKKIIEVAAEYGIEKKDLIFDPLAMTISADNKAALATLEALRIIKNELGCHTSLGISNISFGLPQREVITAGFYTLALENGLSAAIMNPNSVETMKAYYAFRALHGMDDNCTDYIEHITAYAQAAEQEAMAKAAAMGAGTASGSGAAGSGAGSNGRGTAGNGQSKLQHAIIKGLKDQAATLTLQMLATQEPLSIVTGQIIPALDVVGQGFENKTMYLPQLLMAAEASQAAFEKIKDAMEKTEAGTASKGKFVIATVRGDIHDIGKNIVKLIMENYGFDVIDLGKDVPPEVIVDKVVAEHAPLLGLSALMTTTVPAMEETIRQIRVAAPWCKVAVGGAVLTQEYADQIGADFYGKDAMATVRYSLEQVEG